MTTSENGIFQTSDKLTWSHICELVTIDDQLEREFYEKECISEGWTGVATGTGTSAPMMKVVVNLINQNTIFIALC